MSLRWKLLPIAAFAAAVFGLISNGTLGSPKDVVDFDAKTIVLSPTDDGAMRVTEYVDINFGRNQMRGYLRYVRTDLGIPIDISAQSDTMSSQLSTDFDGSYYEMRVGDPDVTSNGQHRFVLSYVLPLAFVDEWPLNYSLIDPDEDPVTDRFHVILDGFRLADPLCSVGGWGEIGGCELVDTPYGQEIIIEPLEANAGLNISGFALLTDERIGEISIPLPEREEPPSSGVLPYLAVLAVLATAGLAVSRNIRRGMNTVGATDAAGAAIPVPGGPTSRVSDSALYEMATVEFAAPKGIRPWEGNVILNEHLGADLQSTWVSSLIGAGAISIEKNGQAVDIELLVSRDELSELDRKLIDLLMPDGATTRRVYKKYTEKFATTWKEIREALVEEINGKQWWHDRLRAWNKRTSVFGAWIWAASSIGGILLLDTAEISDGDGNVVGLLDPITNSAVGITVLAAVLGFWLGAVSTKGRIPSRTAIGSALYLQTESFRRFLAQSEGRHVEEAHRMGVLREYSAWAVVLGEATAWRKAAESLDNLAVSDELAYSQDSLAYLAILTAASTPPSSSGSGGGGGGGSGGGGGGGGSGGW